MWLQVIRRESTRPLTRLVSTTASKVLLPSNPHAILLRKVFRISRYYGRRTDDPIFRTFNWIVRNPEGMIPKPMLTRSGLGVHDYLFWKPALLARDWDVFAEQLAQRDVCLPDADIIAHQVEQPDDRPQPPTWVVLYTLCYNVRSESDAWKALALVYGHLPIAPPHLRPALLMLAACWLTSPDLLAPLQRVVDAFLTGAHGVPLAAFHFQLVRS